MDLIKRFKVYKILAFVKRDFNIEKSYKVGFIITILGSILPVFSYFFIGKLMNNGHTLNAAELYNSNYFSFVLIGVAFSGYFTMALNTFSGQIRRAQMAGCLEAILSSQTGTKTVVFLSSIYSFIHSGIFLIITFVISWLFLGFDFSKINIAAFLISMFLSLMSFIGLGIITAAGTILFKQGDPFTFIFGGISGLLSGALFPIALLPSWLQILSVFVPITYSLDALRLSILQGSTIAMISKQLTTLALISFVIFPLSLFFFQWAVEKGKKDGTLMQY
jgi:ABC-2 type transport system permease protein